MELPFELYKNHERVTKRNWKKAGLISDNIDELYQKYIYATHCELCNKQFTKTIDRQMEHNHETGEFRNIVCNSCNHLKSDKNIPFTTTGYRNILKKNDKKYKQGFYYIFKVVKDGKRQVIKSSVDLETIIKFRNKWIEENDYYK